MSNNKRKYFRVVTTQIVSANSKSDALLAAQRKRGVDANVLSTSFDGERIPATEAHSMTASA